MDSKPLSLATASILEQPPRKLVAWPVGGQTPTETAAAEFTADCKPYDYKFVIENRGNTALRTG